MVILGDTQRTSFVEFWREQNDAAREGIFSAAARENPAAVIILGDLVFQGDSRRHWQWFNEAAAPLRRNCIPIFPILGNHEHYGNSNVGLEIFSSLFPYLQKRRWYSVRKDGIGYILLDAILEHLDEEQIRAQDAWYRRELREMGEDPAIDAVVVCTHYPPYTHSTEVRPDTLVRAKFLAPFLQTPKGAAFFSGHNHSYEHFILEGKHVVVSGGGGGPRFAVDPSAGGSGVPPDRFDGPARRFFHYCLLSRTPDSLRIDIRGFYSPADSLSAMDRIAIPIMRGSR